MLIYGRVCLVARARDCKSPTKKQRWCNSSPAHDPAYGKRGDSDILLCPNWKREPA